MAEGETNTLVSKRQYAKLRGVSHTAVNNAARAGRISLTDNGRIDPAAADAAWDRSRESLLSHRLERKKDRIAAAETAKSERSRPRHSITEKKCSVCTEIKPLSGFHRHRVGIGGVKSICKDCHNAKWSPIQGERYRRASAGRPPKTKECTRCHALQPILSYAFYKNGSGKQRRSDVCGACLEAGKVARSVHGDDGKKRCRICRQFKPLDAFNKLRSSVDGHRHECHECKIEVRRQERIKGGVEIRKRQRAEAKAARDEAVRQRRASRPAKLTPDQRAERYRVKAAQAYAANPERERRRVAVYKRANTDKNRQWSTVRGKRVTAQSDGTLTNGVLVRLYCAARTCPYCAVKLAEANKSLDHLDPIKHGGIHGISNVAVCCKLCNNRKNGRSFAEWLGRLSGVHRAAADRLYRRVKAPCLSSPSASTPPRAESATPL